MGGRPVSHGQKALPISLFCRSGMSPKSTRRQLLISRLGLRKNPSQRSLFSCTVSRSITLPLHVVDVKKLKPMVGSLGNEDHFGLMAQRREIGFRSHRFPPLSARTVKVT